MSFSELPNRRGVVVAILSIVVALGTGHLMQEAYGDPRAIGYSETETPAIPAAPVETLRPVVLVTPPPPSIPETFG